MSETSTLISCTGRITRAELAMLPTPPATETHIPIPHAAVVETLVETLRHRHIGFIDEEFAVSKDDMEMFGVLDLETSFEGCRFAIGIRNANNKRFRLACTVGLRVFVQPRPRETLETFLARRRAVDRSGPDAAELRTDATPGGGLANSTTVSGGGQADDLPGFHRRRSGGSETSSAEGTRTLFQSAARRVPTPNHVEPVERVHVGIQRTRSHPAIPGDGEAGELS